MDARHTGRPRMSARFFADVPLVTGHTFELPAHTARHVQVLRMQPGDRITLFNGQGDGATFGEGEFAATVTRMGRTEVEVCVGDYTATSRELARPVHWVLGMPANERMDWLVEKATELGVASIQPVMSERTVLRLSAERADKKVAHWRGIAIAASEQCGRNRPPLVHPVLTLAQWLHKHPAAPGADAPARLLLSLQTGTQPLRHALDALSAVDAASAAPLALTFLSGPEGGLSPAEEAAALHHGFAPVTLGPRVLRAETAPLACLSFLALWDLPAQAQPDPAA